MDKTCPPRARAARQRGFTLIEMMVTVAILGLLATVAYPAYNDQITRTRRAQAAGCTMELAQFMERVYASNQRYDQNAGVGTTLPNTSCRNETSAYYAYAFAASQPTANTFTILATPGGVQADRDTKCATLSLNQANAKGIGGTGTVAQCWK